MTSFYHEQDYLLYKKRKGICIGYSIAILVLSLTTSLLLLLLLKRDNKALIIALQTLIFSLGGFVFLGLLFLSLLPAARKMSFLDGALHNPAHEIHGKVESVSSPVTVNALLTAKEVTLSLEGGSKILYWDVDVPDEVLHVGQEVRLNVVENLIVGVQDD
jgi:hypothetical protein